VGAVRAWLRGIIDRIDGATWWDRHQIGVACRRAWRLWIAPAITAWWRDEYGDGGRLENLPHERHSPEDGGGDGGRLESLPHERHSPEDGGGERSLLVIDEVAAHHDPEAFVQMLEQLGPEQRAALLEQARRPIVVGPPLTLDEMRARQRKTEREWMARCLRLAGMSQRRCTGGTPVPREDAARTSEEQRS